MRARGPDMVLISYHVQQLRLPNATSVLFGIADKFDVVSVDRVDPGRVKTMIAKLFREESCPRCGCSPAG